MSTQKLWPSFIDLLAHHSVVSLLVYSRPYYETFQYLVIIRV